MGGRYDEVTPAVARGEFRVIPPDTWPAHMRPLATPSGYMRTFPFRDGLEAFFGAVLQRTGGGD